MIYLCACYAAKQFNFIDDATNSSSKVKDFSLQQQIYIESELSELNVCVYIGQFNPFLSKGKQIILKNDWKP